MTLNLETGKSSLLDHVLDGDAKLVHHHVAGSGNAESVNADHYAVKPDVLSPEVADAGLDGHTVATFSR